MLARDDYSDMIDSYFCDFRYELMKRFPQELVILLLKGKEARARFRDQLLGIREVTISDTNLILKFLAQVGFEDLELVGKSAENVHMGRIVTIMRGQRKISLDLTGYYDVRASELKLLVEMPEVIDQIRLRRYSEVTGSYSVALNHLVNELQAICYVLDDTDSTGRGSYNAEAVLKFLETCGVDHNACIVVRNLFDRRNISSIAHPGVAGGIVFGVGKDEYQRFRDAVGVSVRGILSRHSEHGRRLDDTTCDKDSC